MRSIFAIGAFGLAVLSTIPAQAKDSPAQPRFLSAYALVRQDGSAQRLVEVYGQDRGAAPALKVDRSPPQRLKF